MAIATLMNRNSQCLAARAQGRMEVQGIFIYILAFYRRLVLLDESRFRHSSQLLSTAVDQLRNSDYLRRPRDGFSEP